MYSKKGFATPPFASASDWALSFSSSHRSVRLPICVV
jgi:hypothetical protein